MNGNWPLVVNSRLRFWWVGGGLRVLVRGGLWRVCRGFNMRDHGLWRVCGGLWRVCRGFNMRDHGLRFWWVGGGIRVLVGGGLRLLTGGGLQVRGRGLHLCLVLVLRHVCFDLTTQQVGF